MYARIGTIIHASLDPEDLIPAFSEELTALAKRDRDRARRNVARAVAAQASGTAADLEEVLESLTEALELYAPPYAYFGATAGDGSDFGFWPSLSSLEEDARHRDGVVKIEAGTPWPKDLRKRDIAFVMEVNDHGNVSLRRACNGQEVWSVV